MFRLLQTRAVVRLLYALALCAASAAHAVAQNREMVSPAELFERSERDPLPTDSAAADVLSPDDWRRVDRAVERALAWLAAQQRPSGSFPSLELGQPGVSGLCLLAFMAHGHLPGEGPYGERLDRAVGFVMSCQKENGLISVPGEAEMPITSSVMRAAAYNHAISALALGEAYGMIGGDRADELSLVIERSTDLSLALQAFPKARAEDDGGWRYRDPKNDVDSDLSVTGWYLMSLRSARDAGFDVPNAPIDAAVEFVRRTFSDPHGTFQYAIGMEDRTRGVAGAGVLAFGHAGIHKSQEADRAGAWVLQHGFEAYNDFGVVTRERYHYSLFTCCQGMYQLGGPHWASFYPRTVHTLLENQRPSGAWDPENHHGDAAFGNAYTTALVVLALGAPNQLLPIFQR